MSVGDAINFPKSKELLNPIIGNRIFNINLESFLDLCNEGFTTIDTMDIRVLSRMITVKGDKTRGPLVALNAIGDICSRCYERVFMSTIFAKETKLSVTESILKELE